LKEGRLGNSGRGINGRGLVRIFLLEGGTMGEC